MSHTENKYNTKKQSNNKSGVKGVCWDKKRNQWKAYIKINDKVKHLGYFDEIDEARKARQEKAAEICGEYIHNCEK